MATRATIALEYADNTVGQIYVHWDGYLEYTGKTLLTHYQDPFKVQQMIDLGNMSQLGREIHSTSSANTRSEDSSCVFYTHIEDESDENAAHNFLNFDEYVQEHYYQEFEYILRRDGIWYVSSSEIPQYRPLAEELAKLEELDE